MHYHMRLLNSLITKKKSQKGCIKCSLKIWFRLRYYAYILNCTHILNCRLRIRPVFWIIHMFRITCIFRNIPRLIIFLIFGTLQRLRITFIFWNVPYHKLELHLYSELFIAWELHAYSEFCANPTQSTQAGSAQYHLLV